MEIEHLFSTIAPYLTVDPQFNGFITYLLEEADPKSVADILVMNLPNPRLKYY